MKEINEKITNIVAEYTDCPAIEFEDANEFSELNIDSLSLVEIIFDIEECFDIKLPPESELESQGFPLASFTDVVNVVKHLVEQK